MPQSSAPSPVSRLAKGRCAACQFGPDYSEELRLRDGRRARILALHENHASRLLAGFKRLSSESRYTRFLVPKSRLSPDEVDYLTHVDGEHHYALGVEVEAGQGWDGAGVVRIIEDPADPLKADLGVTVLDEYQHCGLGALLVSRILDAAAERGYREVLADVLAENHRMIALLAKLAPDARRLPYEYGVLSFSIPLAGRLPSKPRPETCAHVRPDAAAEGTSDPPRAGTR